MFTSCSYQWKSTQLIPSRKKIKMSSISPGTDSFLILLSGRLMHKYEKYTVHIYLNLNGISYVGNLLIKVKNCISYHSIDITNNHPFRKRQWLIICYAGAYAL